KDVLFIEDTIDRYQLKTDSASVQKQYYDQNDNRDLIMRESDYNKYADLSGEDKVDIQDDTAIEVGDSNKVLMDDSQADRLMDVPIKLQDGETIQPDHMIESDAIPEMFSYYIVSDSNFKALPSPIDQKKTVA